MPRGYGTAEQIGCLEAITSEYSVGMRVRVSLDAHHSDSLSSYL
jgi:hypothetical protein